jgi:hypothetical protein
MRASAARLKKISFAALLAAVLCAWTVVQILQRMRWGVDTTDEAFYAGLPYRFALGDRPFVDELNLAQTGGIVMYPIVKAFVLVNGGATGIIFFLRVVYVIFFAGVGAAAFALARTRLAVAPSLLVAAACICFIPYGAPGLSYNTLGCGCLAIGLFVLARWLLTLRVASAFYKAAPFWAGVAIATAAFCYPPFALLFFIGCAVLLLNARGLRLYGLVRLVVGASLFGMLVLPVVASAGITNLKRMWEYSSYAPYMPQMTLGECVATFFAGLPQLPVALLVIVLALLLTRRFPFVGSVPLVLIPFLAKGTVWPDNLQVMGYVSCFALFGPLFALGVRRRRFVTVLMTMVWVPAVLTALIVMEVSSQRYHGAAIGLFPAAIVTAILLATWIDDNAARWSSPPLRTLFGLAPATLVYVLLGHATGETSQYRDGPLSQMTELVRTGPYDGIRTTAAKHKMLESVQRDVTSHKSGDRITFYYDFPAGYLIAEQRPAVTSPWIFSVAGRNRFDAEFFRDRTKTGDLVVNTQGGVLTDMPLDMAVAQRCTQLVKGDGYVVYTVNR